jgi:ABC-2 type transport system permease protein
MHAVSVSPSPAVRPNAWRAFGGLWGLTWRRFCTPGQFLLLLGMAGLLGLLILVRIRHGQESAFLPWTAQFYLGFILPVMAFLSGAAAIRDEMKSSAADYVLTRPLRRSLLVVFKYLAHLACVQLFYLAVLAALLVLAIAVHAPNVASAAPRLLAVQVTALTSFSALGFLFGVLSARYLVLGMIYAVAVEMAIGRIPTQLNRVSMTHQLSTLLPPMDATVLVLSTAPAGALSVMTLLVGYAAVLVALCALVFSQREMVGAPGRTT